MKREDSYVPIFYQEWWGNVVSQKGFIEFRRYEKEHLTLVWPIFIRKKFFLKVIGLPILTPYFGPYFLEKDTNHKKSKRLYIQQELIQKAINDLHFYARLNIQFHPDVKINLIPIIKSKINTFLNVTYRIDHTPLMEDIRSEFSASTRNKINKAKKTCTIREDHSTTDVYFLYKESVSRNKGTLILKEQTLQEVYLETRRRGCSKILTAINEKNEPIASCFTVWDTKSMYTLMRGSSQEGLKAGAMSAILNELIILANDKKLKFDFVGSMDSKIETFIKGFGAEQVNIVCLSSKLI